MEFARRARRLYPDREAVVDGDLRLTYRQFFDRCDRWSAALQALGVRSGDRVAYIAPNTHAQLESFYAVPQIGAVLVPVNYRLTAADFVYLIQHSGAKVVCAHSDYLEAVDTIRGQIPDVTAFVALESSAPGLAGLRGSRRRRPRHFRAAPDPRERPHHHQLHERHHLAAQGRDDHAPQRLHERGGHARASPHELRGPLPVDAADVPRQRLDVRVDRDRGRGHPRLPAQGRPRRRLREHQAREGHDALRGSYRAHRDRQRSRRAAGGRRAGRCAS